MIEMDSRLASRLLAVCALSWAGCEIEIPEAVFSCTQDRDCPSGWVCEERRCLDPGAEGGTADQMEDSNREAGSGGRAARAGSGGAGAGSGGRAARAGDGAGDAGDAANSRESAAGSHVGASGGSAGASGGNAGTAGHAGEPSVELPQAGRGTAGMPAAGTGGTEPEPCEPGFARDSDGSCVNVDDCPEDACTPGGRCVDGTNDYACVCDEPDFESAGPKACSTIDHCAGDPCGVGTSACVDGVDGYTCACLPGFQSTSPQTCANINECNAVNACSNPSYPCRDAQPFYLCAGQFAATPTPDATPGAAAAPSYRIETDTVIDDVTGLRWQRNPPATYPGCTKTITNPGDACSWSEAWAYCDALVLGGFTEWRLPHKIELESLLDLSLENTASPTVFPASPSTGYWTASAYARASDRYWYVHFGIGWSYFGSSMFESYRVRCVR